MIGRDPREISDYFNTSVLDEAEDRYEAIRKGTHNASEKVSVAAARLALDPGLSFDAKTLKETSRVAESTFYRVLDSHANIGWFTVKTLNREYFGPRYQALKDGALYLATDTIRGIHSTDEAIETWSELYGQIANPAAANEAIGSIGRFSGKADVAPLYEEHASAINESIQAITLADGKEIDEGTGLRVFALAATVDSGPFVSADIANFVEQEIQKELTS